MTFIESLFYQVQAAYPPPKELTIRPGQVDDVADYLVGMPYFSIIFAREIETNRLFIQNQLLLGRVKLLGVPIRVIGQYVLSK